MGTRPGSHLQISKKYLVYIVVKITLFKEWHKNYAKIEAEEESIRDN